MTAYAWEHWCMQECIITGAMEALHLRGGVMNDCYIWPALAALGQNYKLSAVP